MFLYQVLKQGCFRGPGTGLFQGSWNRAGSGVLEQGYFRGLGTGLFQGSWFYILKMYLASINLEGRVRAQDTQRKTTLQLQNSPLVKHVIRPSQAKPRP